MPAVGTRRTTRVFVSKTIAASLAPPPSPTSPASVAARVLRSGKRFSAVAGDANVGDEWLWTLSGDNFEVKRLKAKSFGIVYNRKRPRSATRSDVGVSSSVSPNPAAGNERNDRRYGIVFSRRKSSKRAKLAQASAFSLPSVTLGIPSTVRDFAVKKSLVKGVDADWVVRCRGAPLLAVLLGRTASLHWFEGLLFSLLRWMRRSVAKIWHLAVFLLSGPIAAVFSLNGVHMLPLQRRRDTAIPWNVISGTCGLCKIYGAWKFIPIMAVDFLALPSYFQSLTSMVHLRSLFRPAVIRKNYLMDMGGLQIHGDCMESEIDDDEEEDDLNLFISKIGWRKHASMSSVMPVAEATALQEMTGGTPSLAHDARIVHDSRLRKHQKKRSLSRHTRKYQRMSSLKLYSSTPSAKQSSSRILSQPKPLLSTSELIEVPSRLKPIEISLDLVSGADDSDVSTPLSSLYKHKRAAMKSPVDRTNEKQLLAEIRQNIDSAHCKANILVVQADRCWREDGAEVMMEYTEANKWFIAVKMQGIMRICYKPQDLRPCVVNRYTHAYMWSGEDGWKLEFTDKRDWTLFKELHTECRERNSQHKMIPIPGVNQVLDYEEYVTEPFDLPKMYIRMNDDEIGVALSKDNILYDMDSDDEEWLAELNSRQVGVSSVGSHQLSYNDFERIISAFEKDSFKYPVESGDLDRFLERYPDFGTDYSLNLIYDYWINKRNKKGAALIRIYQLWAPVRRATVTQRPFLRKKRSLKRQRSQAVRGKTEVFLQDIGEEDIVGRVQEAESAVNRAVEKAVLLRGKAQKLMETADLAAYKSVMALRIAEAALTPYSSPDLIAFITG